MPEKIQQRQEKDELLQLQRELALLSTRPWGESDPRNHAPLPGMEELRSFARSLRNKRYQEVAFHLLVLQVRFRSELRVFFESYCNARKQTYATGQEEAFGFCQFLRERFRKAGRRADAHVVTWAMTDLRMRTGTSWLAWQFQLYHPSKERWGFFLDIWWRLPPRFRLRRKEIHLATKTRRRAENPMAICDDGALAQSNSRR